jgi:SAM-dependent methyltransferase
MYHWKSTRFAPHLESGDWIYESACGIGMNLYMTLEILNEVKGIESLKVFGNEYISLSVEVASAVFDSENPPFKAQKGTICRGDSANLDFVSSNTFDLVYTGYIT